jgi:hypothetical protein
VAVRVGGGRRVGVGDHRGDDARGSIVAGEVRQRAGDPGVDHRDAHARAGRRRLPRLRRLDPVRIRRDEARRVDRLVLRPHGRVPAHRGDTGVAPELPAGGAAQASRDAADDRHRAGDAATGGMDDGAALGKGHAGPKLDDVGRRPLGRLRRQRQRREQRGDQGQDRQTAP